ncbi:unnamed protein product [Cylicocyclus nassatus]|uniref:Beta-1,4-glucuronyltransferase 1 n=1 Tax=Cylicocyclus nassatus TaxID=53992 RepID=A0AA36GW84_CYLNA|nr:unnamed protein product [Cylicocyclus nassatus]
MMHFFGSSKTNLLCLYCLAVFILLVEYWNFTSDPSPSPLSHSPSFLYHNYCVLYNFVTPKTTDFERIGQILHVSADQLDSRIIEQVANWNAPVSLSVVLRSLQEYHCTAEYLRLIHRESPVIARNLRAHIIFPSVFSPNCTIPSVLKRARKNCKYVESTIEQIALYPANIARNVARMFSATKYIIITDYEHLFSEGFEFTVRSVADERLAQKPETMLVYRIFEINESSNMPRNKVELKKLYNKGAAVVFHAIYYPGAHDIEGLPEWFAKKNSSDGLFVKDQKYERFNWEPQFVSHWRIPFHDETFPFRLRDNTVLRWEMCRAGYTIDILDDVFMYHKGIKGKTSGAKTRAIQRQNSKKFSDALANFIKRMDAVYPKTKEQCPKPRK